MVLITKLSVTYADGVKQTFINDDFAVIVSIMKSIISNSEKNNQPKPEFDFDEWEN